MNSNHRQLVAENDPILKAIAVPVQPGENVEAVMQTMQNVCLRSKVKGAGLAAPQIGVSKRLIFINVKDVQFFMLNPVIISHGDFTSVEVEGCLSYPGKEKKVARATGIIVEYLTSRRAPRRQRYYGYVARVIQHEIDHLNGICRVGDDSPPDGVK